MRKAGFALALATAIFAVITLSAQTSQVEPAKWSYSKQDDPLHGISFDQFVLDGKYLTPPSVATTQQPSLVVHCSNGKFREGFLIVGGVVQYAPGLNGGVAHSLKGGTQAYIEMRWDDKKKVDGMALEISNDGKALSFDKVELSKLLTGRLLGHPGNSEQLVQRQILGVVEAFGNRIVMQFDMPQDDSQMVEACGLEWGKEKKKH